MGFKVTVHESSDEERRVWETWTAFTDRIKVAPDSTYDADWLARRFNHLVPDEEVTAEDVWKLMPWHHPNYGSWRAT